jgi:hypothetical protein
MREFITGAILAGDARMRRTVFKGAFLFVEGESDDRFYGIFTDRRHCQIIICHGRENLFDACNTLDEAGFAGFLGIADADFSHLEGKSPPIANIIFTDFHDAECLMLQGQALGRVFLEFSSEARLSEWRQTHGIDPRTHLITLCVTIGNLLWHSLAEGLNLSFDKLEAKEFVGRHDLVLEAESLVQHVKNKSNRHDIQNEALLSGIESRRRLNGNEWQVLRGHDFVDLLHHALRHAWGNQNVSRDRLEQGLRLAFPESEFATSGLFRRIKAWELANSPFRILNDPLTRNSTALI